jgi:hypothetical protein
LIFSGGFLFAQFETFRADSPFLKYPITTDIDAVIEWQEKRVNSSLFILKVLKADKIHPRYRPHRVRVYGKQVFLENTQPGCEVSVILQLRPSEFTIWPDGYEPRFVSHFRQEGAVGFIREFKSINCEPLDDSSRVRILQRTFFILVITKKTGAIRSYHIFHVTIGRRDCRRINYGRAWTDKTSLTEKHSGIQVLRTCWQYLACIWRCLREQSMHYWGFYLPLFLRWCNHTTHA